LLLANFQFSPFYSVFQSDTREYSREAQRVLLANNVVNANQLFLTPKFGKGFQLNWYFIPPVEYRQFRLIYQLVYTDKKYS